MTRYYGSNLERFNGALHRSGLLCRRIIAAGIGASEPATFSLIAGYLAEHSWNWQRGMRPRPASGVVFQHNALLSWRPVAEDVEPGLFDAPRVIAASRRQIFRKAILPSSLPGVYTALQIGAAIGELVASRSGLGQMILFASPNPDTPTVHLGIIIPAGFAACRSGAINALVPVGRRFADET